VFSILILSLLLGFKAFLGVVKTPGAASKTVGRQKNKPFDCPTTGYCALDGHAFMRGSGEIWNVRS
jgi:hypothetical protein